MKNRPIIKERHLDDESPDDSADAEEVAELRRLFIPMSQVVRKPATWVIEGLLVEGLNLMAGAPKTFKSTLVLEMIASMLHKRPAAGGKNGKRVAMKRGPVVYFNADQSPSSLKNIYEGRITKKKFPKFPESWDFTFPKNAYRWQIDVIEDPKYDMARFIRLWKPQILIIDPLIRFHSIDENDPQLIKPLVPLQEEMKRIGGALVVVHHARKKGNNDSAAGPYDFDKVRGTSALWGMADAGIILNRLPSGGIDIQADFKEHPSRRFTWRPPT